MEAPTPKPILRTTVIDVPAFYGYEYHGEIGHLDVEKILNGTPDGSYLIRKSPKAKDFYTLSLRFNEKIKHFKIYYKSKEGFCLQENFKIFETIHDLVADGLVNFYMQLHAAPIIQSMISQTRNSCQYQQSPYMTLNRRKLKALSNEICKSIKSENIETIPLIICSNQEEMDVLPIVYEKHHNFKVHTFKGLNWCEFCANFLWGFTAQGVKCEDCGFCAHYKCSEMVPPKCVPDLKKIRGVFGTDLTTLVTARHCLLPFVVRNCVEEVECRGMLQEGIYRVSGFADEIEALKLALDRHGEKTDMSESSYSINVIAGTLKLYLRLLPIPLITFQVYPHLMSAIRVTTLSEQIPALRDSMKLLPSAHYHCLKYMLQHLQRVASHYAVNKMNQHNLATGKPSNNTVL